MSTSTRSRTTARSSISAPPATARRTRSAGTTSSSPAGFTLIELVLVLVVLALGSVIALPALQPALEAAEIENEARQAAAYLDEARRQAVFGRKPLVVRCQPREARLEFEGGVEKARPPSVRFLAECSAEEVRYLPQGSAENKFSLVLRDKRGRERRVTVSVFTGLASIAPG